MLYTSLVDSRISSINSMSNPFHAFHAVFSIAYWIFIVLIYHFFHVGFSYRIYTYNHICMFALKHCKMDYKSIHVCIWHQLENYVLHTMWLCGCFLKWWYPQNTPKMIILVGKPNPWLLGKPTILGNPHVRVTYLLLLSLLHVYEFPIPKGFPFAKPRIHQVGPSLYRDQSQN